jgi:protein involved in polysaccharide export with SLBB domain
MVRRVIVWSALLVVALLVFGCSGGTLTDAEKQSLALAATEPATLQPGDKINIVVFGEEGLGGQYEVDQAGQVSLPLAGTIKAQGMTQSQLEQALAKKFRSEYLKHPKVTVTIASLAPYYIIGEVKEPGQKSYRSGLNVLTAIAIAGGPTYRASRNTVEIQHRSETKMQEYPLSASVPVLPGDVIKVPERYF